MTNESTSRELIVGGADMPAPSSAVEVLYVDAEAAVRERTRAAMADQRSDLSVASVGTVEAAVEVATATPPACLVVDPVGLGDIGPLLDVVDAPVIVYTEREPTELADPLAGAMRTVVEKGPTNRGGFLAEKVISTVDTPTARSEYALQQALAGVSRQAETGQAVFLVEDGDIVWSSMSLVGLVGTSDPPATDDIYEQLAALCAHQSGVIAVEQFSRDPPESTTIRTGAAANERHLLLQRYPLPDETTATSFVLVRDVTETAGRDARLSMLELLTEQAQDGLYTLDERGIIDFCNESFAKNLGYEPAELRGEHAEQTLAPGELEKGQRTIAELLSSERDSTTVDLTFQRKDGTEREISIHYTLLYDQDGGYSGLMGVTRDITERIERERELERRKELFDGIVDHFPNGAVFLFDDDLQYTMAGGDELERVGLDQSDILGQTPSAVFPPENADRLEQAHQDALVGEESSFHATVFGRHYEIQTIPIRDSDGAVVSGMALAQNVTERVQRERELEQSNTLLSTLFDALPVGILVEDSDREILTVNQRFVDLFDIPQSPDDLVGTYCLDNAEAIADVVADREAFLSALERLPDGRQRRLNEHLELADGRVFQRSYLPVDLPTGPANIWLYRDITDRIERERELEQTTERLELALEGAELGVWDWNVETGEIAFDDRWAGMLGYSVSELAPRLETWEELVHPEDSDRVWETMDTHLAGGSHTFHCEYRLRTNSGEYRWTRDIGRVVDRDDDGRPLRAVGIHQDITERKERQRELETQRDELATLAQVHGLIHDVIGALGSAATRSAIEETVCDRLVESELYQFACIGEREGASTQLRRKTVAGDDDGYLDIVSERSDAGDGNPGTEAIRTGEAQVVHDIETDDRVASWRDAALAREFRSALVVPLRHDEAIHGVLAVYANRPEAFSQRAVEAFTVLGEMVGFAYTAVQNRQLLAHDRVVEMEFQSTSPEAYPLDVATKHDCVLRGSGSVDLGDEVLAYMTVEGAPPEAVLPDFLDHDSVPNGRVIRADGDSGVIELRAAGSYQSALLDVGVRPIDFVADGESLTITVEAPLDAEPRTILDTLSEHAPGFELVVKQARDRQPTDEGDSLSLCDELTDRQREVLRSAYLAGYYEWPRDTTAEQLAETLDIASSTLHQHLRRAERNLLGKILDM
ncbi:PAS domain S-box protein [Haloarcula salinisoli]|uniref:histidine kinase n=1 Tax=Haloarcula salinisoli TaxID=2487746 RepID=A0A8J8C9U2_9EURY|nr:PAS domain S-box protein [Halomicroarcula salinisoli]MBX0286203.1 PAS domain S-box protein [Halomicroarcula salinisoli]MBX0302308.1 PAS domain S-box protein [Halomicroarcula salinisoli]